MLRNRLLGGYKFRRQHPVGGYILDFYCPKVKLGIEVDGEVHKFQAEYDRQRENDIRDLGVEIIRFWNSEVENHPEDVAKRVMNRIHELERKIDASTNNKKESDDLPDYVVDDGM